MAAENHAPRWLDLDGAANARAVVPRVLLRSDNLQSLTAGDVKRLVVDEGLEVVVDLRTEFEVRLEGAGPMTREAAVRTEHRSLFPAMGDNTDLEGGTVKPWGTDQPDGLPDENPVVRSYMSYLDRRPDSVVGSVRTIARTGGAVLVHCAAGKDRTGVVVAVALDAAGVDRDVIVHDYLATGQRMQAILDRLVSSPTYRRELEGSDPHRHAPVPETMERVLELVDRRFGGSAAYLQEQGLDERDLGLLRQRLAPAAE